MINYKIELYRLKIDALTFNTNPCTVVTSINDTETSSFFTANVQTLQTTDTLHKCYILNVDKWILMCIESNTLQVENRNE